MRPVDYSDSVTEARAIRSIKRRMTHAEREP